jgi:hypothetical protein
MVIGVELVGRTTIRSLPTAIGYKKPSWKTLIEEPFLEKMENKTE